MNGYDVPGPASNMLERRIDMMIPFGLHRGKEIADLPTEYISMLIGRHKKPFHPWRQYKIDKMTPEIIAELKAEYSRRGYDE